MRIKQAGINTKLDKFLAGDQFQKPDGKSQRCGFVTSSRVGHVYSATASLLFAWSQATTWKDAPPGKF